MRPPGVSIVFFAIAVAIILYGAYSARETAPPHDSAVDRAPPPIADAIAKTRTGPDFGWRFNALDPGVVASGAAASLFDPGDDYWGLPRTDGVDLVAGYCAACHSLRIVMQQSASEARWRELMDWMIDKQGMAAPADDDLELIIDYLSEHFGA